jgi:hypothetical protein
MQLKKPPWLLSCSPGLIFPAFVIICIIMLSLTSTFNLFPSSTTASCSSCTATHLRPTQPVAESFAASNSKLQQTVHGGCDSSRPSHRTLGASSRVGFGARQLTLGPSPPGMGSETAAAAASTGATIPAARSRTRARHRPSELHPDTPVLKQYFNALKTNSCALHTHIPKPCGKNWFIQFKPKAFTPKLQPIPTAPAQQLVEPAKSLVCHSVIFYPRYIYRPLKKLSQDNPPSNTQVPKHRRTKLSLTSSNNLKIYTYTLTPTPRNHPCCNGGIYNQRWNCHEKYIRSEQQPGSSNWDKAPINNSTPHTLGGQYTTGTSTQKKLLFQETTEIRTITLTQPARLKNTSTVSVFWNLQTVKPHLQVLSSLFFTALIQDSRKKLFATILSLTTQQGDPSGTHSAFKKIQGNKAISTRRTAHSHHIGRQSYGHRINRAARRYGVDRGRPGSL